MALGEAFVEVLADDDSFDESLAAALREGVQAGTRAVAAEAAGITDPIEREFASLPGRLRGPDGRFLPKAVLEVDASDAKRAAAEIDAAIPEREHVDIEADTAKARREVRALDTELDRTSQSGSRLVAAIAAVGAAGVAAGIRRVIGEYSALEEQTSGTTVVKPFSTVPAALMVSSIWAASVRQAS